MPVQILENGNLCNKYVAECPVCKSKVTYLGLDVKAHRNYPSGFVYCPKCRRPIPHDENNMTTDGPSSDSIRTQIVDNLLSQRKQVSKQGRSFIIFGIVLFGLGLAMLIGSIVGLFAGEQSASMVLCTMGITFSFLFIIAGIGLTISMSITRNNRVERINRKLTELNYNAYEK